MMPAAGWLMNADPRRVQLVIACSAAKARGGQPTASGRPEPGDWPEALHVARARVLAGAGGDASRLLPAWQRYEGASNLADWSRPIVQNAAVAAA